MMDFISTKVVDQLRIKTNVLVKLVPLFLAVSGSRSVINHSATVNLKYQGINCERSFDVCNLDAYNIVLGTPFLSGRSCYGEEHKVSSDGAE
jgi:hypothetical protein